MTSVSERVFIGLGSNLGDRECSIERAISLLKGTRGIELIRRASLYETEPVGLEDQPWFFNTAIEIRTKLSPQELLALLKDVERQLGRKTRQRWGPREIDLDLLLYGERVRDEPHLQIPHAQLHQRRFMLVPLAEIAPDAVHPRCKKTITQLLEALHDQKGVVPLRGSQKSEGIKRF